MGRSAGLFAVRLHSPYLGGNRPPGHGSDTEAVTRTPGRRALALSSERVEGTAGAASRGRAGPRPIERGARDHRSVCMMAMVLGRVSADLRETFAEPLDALVLAEGRTR